MKYLILILCLVSANAASAKYNCTLSSGISIYILDYMALNETWATNKSIKVNNEAECHISNPQFQNRMPVDVCKNDVPAYAFRTNKYLVVIDQTLQFDRGSKLVTTQRIDSYTEKGCKQLMSRIR